MDTTSLVVGDIHVKTHNLHLMDALASFLEKQVEYENPDIVVLLGDILDYHEKILTPCLNKAYSLISRLAKLRPVYILVGNHDYISNSQFLTDTHWMNAMKLWPNVTVVDTVIVERGIAFCPYVSPGRFAEALQTVEGATDAKLIMCHQEFRGCDLGVIKSEHGDTYHAYSGLVVSGHIHDNQWLCHDGGMGVYYVGAPLQHAFGDKEKRVVAMIGKDLSVREIGVGIGQRACITVSYDNLGDVVVRPGVETRVTIVATVAECKAFKKTQQYKQLAKKAKIVFRNPDTVAVVQPKARGFADICREKVCATANPAIIGLYDSLFV